MPPGKLGTYVRYSDDQIPALPGYLGSWDWLRASLVHPDSALARAQEGAARDLTPQALAELPISRALPTDFAGFVSDPELRMHLRSAAWCCFGDPGFKRVSVSPSGVWITAGHPA